MRSALVSNKEGELWRQGEVSLKAFGYGYGDELAIYVGGWRITSEDGAVDPARMESALQAVMLRIAELEERLRALEGDKP